MGLFHWFKLEGRKVVISNEPPIESQKINVTDLEILDNKVRVSTVFLGMDTNYSNKGLPVVFETMVFGGPHEQSQFRYTSYEAAERGHELIVKYITGRLYEDEFYKSIEIEEA